MGAQHLHRDDCPAALAVLAALSARRVERAAEIGYRPSGAGAWVDWEALEQSWLSSTERAAVVVARGIAMAEHQGGWNARMQGVIADAVGNVGGGR